ncbi:hypothetical protein, unlikely [Trypanosoma brucei gambiense DAL972]|uniref:Uncharacterized protein n=1 Tax=Trypanosoma brucei gambiense (strain MHOM/CI/86/DAL972) TaxID=679716 RepID=D0AAL7_TRYB9|nr:hypothetical protein, unlikely [Trypanosoma brucei gambiense DAL972]CBH18718.1 hypothetical protein, unlikely [Trypanosoma brucei gambiense DAL972]|eukprot:XP_011780982.1 hypothetical protein, unlikely [Trypanosoma brucei gambiense DAL972]
MTIKMNDFVNLRIRFIFLICCSFLCLFSSFFSFLFVPSRLLTLLLSNIDVFMGCEVGLSPPSFFRSFVSVCPCFVCCLVFGHSNDIAVMIITIKMKNMIIIMMIIIHV